MQNALSGREGLCARWGRDGESLWSKRNLLRRSRREHFTLGGFRLRFRFGCFLYFFAAFVFASHAEQFATSGRPEQRVLSQVNGRAHPVSKRRETLSI